MFDFLKRRRERRRLADCQKEIDRILAANLYWRAPEQATLREQLLLAAAEAGLRDHETVRRLDFLHRLVALHDEEPPLPVAESFLDEAERHGLTNYSGVRGLRKYTELLRLKEHGPCVVAHDAEGRAVYFRCHADFKNKSGTLEFREDGVTFTGEVVVDVAWSNVAHAAKGTHTYRGDELDALALQEGKRRTPTKFVLLSSDAEYVCTLGVMLWERSRRGNQAAEPPSADGRPQSGRSPRAPTTPEAPRRRARASRDVGGPDPDPAQVPLPPLPARPPTLPKTSADSAPEKIDATEATRRPVSISAGQGFNLSIVGESHYQLALRRVSDGQRERGEGVAFRAWLVPESSNPYDPNAVAVVLDDGKKIGYLAREWAAEYQRPLRELYDQGLAPYCHAKLVGGCGDKANFGVLLDVRDPTDGLIAPF